MTAPTLDLDALDRLAAEECEAVARSLRHGCGGAPSVQRRAVVADALRAAVDDARLGAMVRAWFAECVGVSRIEAVVRPSFNAIVAELREGSHA